MRSDVDCSTLEAPRSVSAPSNEQRHDMRRGLLVHGEEEGEEVFR